MQIRGNKGCDKKKMLVTLVSQFTQQPVQQSCPESCLPSFFCLLPPLTQNVASLSSLSHVHRIMNTPVNLVNDL